MKEVKIEIADKEYKVLIAETEEERAQGLGNVESMDDDEGMLFIMPEDQGQVVFNTEEMEFDIDLVFINQDDEVYNVVLGKAHSSEPIISTPEDEEGRTKYVLEVNANSGIQIGDELDFEEDIDEKGIRQTEMVALLQLENVMITREALVKIERGIQHIQATQLRAIKNVLETTYDELLK